MEENLKNIDEIIISWLESAENDFATMENLYDSENYNWALFIGHLVIEKTLKALYVKNHKQHAAFSHDLLRLAKKVDLDLSDEHKEWLDVITTFNINARYDNYKQDFYRLCTKEFTKKWLTRIKILRLWLKSLL